ncbi:MAG: class I SAM-dependent methyltransferase [Phycisphaerales bacterium]|nr:class I SAM-dependent methyltransferase [Phycisphaerales bacterium]
MFFMSNYTPNDSSITVEALDFLHSAIGESLLSQLADNPSPTISQIEKLRKAFSKDAVHAALTLSRLQPKARQKFPRLADRFIYAIPEALEQATDSSIAAHKATRFAQVNPTQILDLCAGIGGDALALADIAPTVAVDLSASRLACLRYNAQAVPLKFSLQTRQVDAITMHDSAALFHIDPARRSQGKRSPRYEDLIPGPDFLEQLITSKTFRGGGIKLSSAVDFDSLPEGHLEIISHDQVVVQAVLWLGELAALFPPNARTATVFKKHRLFCSYTHTPNREPIPAKAGAIWTHLYEFDPAFTRSQLAAPFAESIGLAPLTIDGGYLAGPQLPPHPALTAFLVHQILPYSESKLLKALAGQSANVEVKTRGKLPGIDTDHLQKRFSAAPSHSTTLTVLIFKPIGSESIRAAIATRVMRKA